MTKLNKQIAVLALLLALMAVATIIAYRLPDAEERQAQEQEKAVQINSGDVQAVVLSNSSGTAAFLNTPMGVIADGDDAGLYSQQKLISLVYGLTHIDADMEIAEPEADGFGFDTPAAQVSILLDNSTVRLTLGRRSPVAEEYYLKNEDSGKVYLVSAEAAELMTQPADDLRDLALFPAISSENLAQLQQIRIGSGDSSMLLCQVQTDTLSTFFGLLEPVVAVLNWENVYRQVLSAVFTLTPDHYVSDSRPLSDFGLDAPEYTLELLIDGQTYRCGFSAKDPDTYYCANLDKTLVCEIKREKIDFLSVNYIDLIGNSVYNRSAADVSRLSAKYSGGSVSLEITGEGESLTASTGTQQLDSAETVELFRSIGTIPMAAELSGTEETQSPVLTLCYTMRDGSEDIIEFMPVSDRQCAVFINGSAEFATYLTSAEDIIRAFDRLK